MTSYCKRLIEVDFPLRKVGELVRKTEKKFPMPRGHSATLHAWWARRPQGACRAILLAALWPDPVDHLCPESFIEVSSNELNAFARRVSTDKYLANLMDAQSWEEYRAITGNPINTKSEKARMRLRGILLRFIADFTAWKPGNSSVFIDLARSLTRAAYSDGAGLDSTKPIVYDPFSGGATIPLEALRIGAEAVAVDINPVSILVNKVLLDYIPRYGQRLADGISKWAEVVDKESKQSLGEFFPSPSSKMHPVAYLWARTIICEGPGCGVQLPLLRSLWIAQKGNTKAALEIITKDKKRGVEFVILTNPSLRDVGKGTVQRGSATCPFCGYTTPADRVRQQFIGRAGGANDARLVVVIKRDSKGSYDFSIPTDDDSRYLGKAFKEYQRLRHEKIDEISAIPDEPLPYLRSIFNVKLIGVDQWGDLFSYRQVVSILTYVKTLRSLSTKIEQELDGDKKLSVAVITCLALALDKIIDYNASLCQWRPTNLDVGHVFGRQALGIVWDFVETNPIADCYVDWNRACGHIVKTVTELSKSIGSQGHVQLASATDNILPDNSVDAFITDPPYYDMVPYADLSDFFYVWLKRSIATYHSDLFSERLTPKEREIVQLAERNKDYAYKTRENYENQMREAMNQGRKCLRPNGIAVIVFAHKSTATWETQLQAMVDAGWVIVASWPIDTEMGSRLRAQNSAVLTSSIHLVCRPREKPESITQNNKVGDWRDILLELPLRIHAWMPRLASEGVVGADAIFACLGPALEIFSRYSHVEKASGEQVTLREYLEYIWAAVAKEALNMIFEGADATGFEEDARLTAMWLWTLSTKNNGNGKSKLSSDDEEPDDEDESEKAKKAIGGYGLEYDAARKIAQGLGAHLEKLTSVLDIKGDTARLLPVAERTRYLFGKDETDAPTAKRKKKEPQLKLGFMQEIEDIETREGWGAKSSPKAGSTVLDRIHQSMILFAAGRSEALKRFLVEEGAGNDQRFWRLAQALSALYPKSSDEKRWVDGVLARKKGLGF